MRLRLALVGLASLLILTSCGSDTSTGESDDSSRTNQEKVSDFNDCISGGLGDNAVEIKETIDNCSSANLNP
jgi:hypothetical protein